MASSRLSEDRRYVIITTPDAFSEVGDVFEVIADAATYRIGYADWVLRVCTPPPTSSHMNGHSTAATERVSEALQTGVVHGSLCRGPRAMMSGNPSITLRLDARDSERPQRPDSIREKLALRPSGISRS